MSDAQKRAVWIDDTLYESVSAALRATGYGSSSLYRALGGKGEMADGTKVRFATEEETGRAPMRRDEQNPGNSRTHAQMRRMAAAARKDAAASAERADMMFADAQAERDRSESLAKQAEILEDAAARLREMEPAAPAAKAPAKKPKPGPVPAPVQESAPQPKMVGNPPPAPREDSEPDPTDLTRADIERARILVNGTEFEDVRIAADEMEMDVDDLIEALLSGATTHGDHDDEIGLADSDLEAERREAAL